MAKVNSYLAIYRKEKNEKRFYPMCPISFKKMRSAEFIYSWDGIINTFVKIAYRAEESKRILQGLYKPTEYQVRDKDGNIYATREY